MKVIDREKKNEIFFSNISLYKVNIFALQWPVKSCSRNDVLRVREY